MGRRSLVEYSSITIRSVLLLLPVAVTLPTFLDVAVADNSATLLESVASAALRLMNVELP